MRSSEQVLRPAVLQPSQTQSCQKAGTTFGPGALKSYKTKEKAEHEVRKIPGDRSNSEMFLVILGNERVLPGPDFVVAVTPKWKNCAAGSGNS
jgi:hypothetical protein